MVDKKTGQSYLFTISINNYVYVDPLNVAVKCAHDLKDVLSKKYGFSEENVLHLHDEEATRKNIIHYLRSFSLGLNEEDSLIVFYSGHGVIDELTREGYWIPADADEENMAEWVGNYEVKKYLEYCKARHILVLCDSFFYGSFLQKYESKKAITQDMLTRWYIQSSVQFIFSGQTPHCPDSSFQGRSPFAHYIIESLLDTKEKSFIASVLFSDLCARYVEKEMPFPFFNVLKRGTDPGEYFFFVCDNNNDDDTAKREISHVNKKIHNIEEKINSIEQQKLLRLQSDISTAQGRVKQGRSDDLDHVIKMFKEKEKVENQLIELKEIKQQLHEENTRRMELVQSERVTEVQNRLMLEIEKYNLFISSELCDDDIKIKAWDLVIRQCPDWWKAKEVGTHDVEKLMLPPEDRDFKTIHDRIISSGFRFVGKRTYICGGNQYEIEEFEHKITNLPFSLIPAGSFIMGGNRYEWEKPERQVRIKPFLICKYIVSQEFWQKITGENPSFFKGDEKPVESISWEECIKFCEKTNLSLPTEAQWEYAARANTNTEFYWGNDMSDSHCWFGDNSDEQTHNIGKKEPNAFGLYDMLGNVWEWCLDTWHPNYENAPVDGSAWIDQKDSAMRVIRGGSFYYIAEFCRCAYRGRIDATRGNRFLGFRVVYNF